MILFVHTVSIVRVLFHESKKGGAPQSYDEVYGPHRHSAKSSCGLKTVM